MCFWLSLSCHHRFEFSHKKKWNLVDNNCEGLWCDFNTNTHTNTEHTYKNKKIYSNFTKMKVESEATTISSIFQFSHSHCFNTCVLSLLIGWYCSSINVHTQTQISVCVCAFICKVIWDKNKKGTLQKFVKRKVIWSVYMLIT